ncbi:MAG: helix-turn-helix transcriptional regulator [Candidatus Omnitrophica bacterium]|nr:helix-turn-helix transcriptional regulator [Candidatus Omnitrophota bacterium]
MKINWLWDTRLSETRVKKILEDEKNPRFYIYAEKLFSRVGSPQTAFSYIPKEVFCRQWPVIKQRIDKDAWSKGKADSWQKIYDQISAQLDVHGNALSERMGIAQQIKEVRLQLGYTQVEMAEKLGVIQQFISKLETGRENLTIDTLKRIADVFEKKLIIRLG